MTTSAVQEGSTAEGVDEERVERSVDTLDDVGICIEPVVIPTEKADTVNEVVREILAREMTDETREKGQQRIGEIALKHVLFRELMCHPLILAVWRRLLGIDMVCSTWTANTIHPGSGSSHWHVDHPFWAMQAPYPVEWLAGQSVWMLDDLTEANGATGYVPGSHTRCHPPANPEEAPVDACCAVGTRGSVVFAHGGWWHSSHPNQSDAPRSVLLGMYVSTIVLPMEDMRSQLERLDNPTEMERQIMGANQRFPVNIVTPGSNHGLKPPTACDRKVSPRHGARAPAAAEYAMPAAAAPQGGCH